MKKELIFKNALKDIFTGADIEGTSGYVNLLNIKKRYFDDVFPELNKEIELDTRIDTDFKEEFYDKLYNFFHRYFSESGSIYFRHTPSYQKVYEQVYSEGKDVVLFWKTHMLYYVKSDVIFQSAPVEVTDEDHNTFSFFIDASSIENKKSNERKDLAFAYDKTSNKDGKKTIFINAQYSERGKKTKLEDIYKAVKKDGIVNITEEVVEKAFQVFNKQSEVDFFINKDARGFLKEQFDLWMYQYMFKEENNFSQLRIKQMQAIKDWAYKIIDFIGQFEDELVKVWNKPKFVRGTNYVITIDKISDTLIKKIEKHSGIKSQIAEWRELSIVEANFDFKKQDAEKHKHLPIDTKYFKDLELEIIGEQGNLDESLDGLLIHSENYQALNTIRNKFSNSIDLVYIDPPFNTGNDFIFQDNFQDSTWLSLINERIVLSRYFLNSTANYYLQLDHIAEHYSKQLLDNVFGQENFQAKITWNTGDNISGFKSQAMSWIRQADFIHHYSTADKNYFVKCFELLNKEDVNLGWLDLLGKNKNRLYKEKWVDGKFIEEEVNYPVKAKGTIWNDIYSFQYSEPRITESMSFVSNQKPENLLRRIIQSSCPIKGTVLDYFAGSGTTCAVAQKLNRKWIGVETGQYFNEIYLDTVKVKKIIQDEDEESEEIINEAIVEVLSETAKERTVLMKKIGILGRMKIVLKGDKQFKVIHTTQIRRPHLSKDVNWEGGGFFKYYSLEQYEETLARARYSKDNNLTIWDGNKSSFAQYIFNTDQKLTDFIKVSSKDINLNLNDIYPDIDIAETLSNITGKHIAKKNVDTVEFVDGTVEKINPEKMNLDEKMHFISLIKPLIWWGE